MSKLDKNMEEMLDIEISTTPEPAPKPVKDQSKDTSEALEKD